MIGYSPQKGCKQQQQLKFSMKLAANVKRFWTKDNSLHFPRPGRPEGSKGRERYQRTGVHKVGNNEATQQLSSPTIPASLAGRRLLPGISFQASGSSVSVSLSIWSTTLSSSHFPDCQTFSHCFHHSPALRQHAQDKKFEWNIITDIILSKTSNNNTSYRNSSLSLSSSLILCHLSVLNPPESVFRDQISSGK